MLDALLTEEIRRRAYEFGKPKGVQEAARLQIGCKPKRNVWLICGK